MTTFRGSGKFQVPEVPAGTSTPRELLSPCFQRGNRSSRHPKFPSQTGTSKSLFSKGFPKFPKFPPTGKGEAWELHLPRRHPGPAGRSPERPNRTDEPMGSTMNDAAVLALPVRGKLVPVLPQPSKTARRRRVVKPGDVVLVALAVHAPHALQRRGCFGILVNAIGDDGTLVGTVGDADPMHGAVVVLPPEAVRDRLTGQQARRWLATEQGAIDHDKAMRA
jgi:hypothetical protein